MKVQSFGHLQDGREAQLYVLENDMLQVRISNYGATIVAVYDKVLERHLARSIGGYRRSCGESHCQRQLFLEWHQPHIDAE